MVIPALNMQFRVFVLFAVKRCVYNKAAAPPLMGLLLYLLVSVFELACHHVDWNLIFCSAAQAHAAYTYVVYNLYYTAI